MRVWTKPDTVGKSGTLEEMKPANFLYEETDRAYSPELLRLMRAAASSLQAEDAALGAAFSQAPDQATNHYNSQRGHHHPGLTYWVFENTLVYFIFKAWLPVATTEWESSYERAGRKKADLVVRDVPGGPWFFEAKWFPSSQTKVLTALSSDARKLLEWTSAGRCFLLTFWYSPNKAWVKDLGEVDAYCDLPAADRAVKAKRLYAAAFPTARRLDQVPSHDWYFAVSLLEISHPG